MRWRDIQTVFEWALFTLVVIGFILWAQAVFGVPEVRWSQSENACVEVVPDDVYDCGDLPPRYTKVWVR